MKIDITNTNNASEFKVKITLDNGKTGYGIMSANDTNILCLKLNRLILKNEFEQKRKKIERAVSEMDSFISKISK